MAEETNEERLNFKTFQELLNLSVKDEPEFGTIYQRVRDKGGDKAAKFESFLAIVSETTSYLEANKPEILNSEIKINNMIEGHAARWKGSATKKASMTKTTRDIFEEDIRNFGSVVSERDIERNRFMRIIGLQNAALKGCSLYLERLYSNPVDISDSIKQEIASLKKDVGKISEKISKLDTQFNVKPTE